MRARALRNWLFSTASSRRTTSIDQGSSLLLDFDGLVVDRVPRDDAGGRVVYYSTDTCQSRGCRGDSMSRLLT